MQASLLSLRHVFRNSSSLPKGKLIQKPLIIPSKGRNYTSGKPGTPPWSAAEFDQLRQLRSEGKSPRDIALSLGRSLRSVRKKVWLVNHDAGKITSVPKSYWTESEVSKLVEARKQGVSIKQISGMLGRTPAAISSKMNGIGLRRAGRPKVPRVTKKRDWTAEEIQHLHELLHHGASEAEIATAMHRSMGSVRGRILRGNAIRFTFTKEEDAKLKSLLENGVEWKAVAAAFTSRSWHSLYSRASRLGLTKPRRKKIYWSQEELTTLTQLRAEGKGYGEISQHLPGRSAEACRAKLQYIQDGDADATRKAYLSCNSLLTANGRNC